MTDVQQNLIQSQPAWLSIQARVYQEMQTLPDFLSKIFAETQNIEYALALTTLEGFTIQARNYLELVSDRQTLAAYLALLDSIAKGQLNKVGFRVRKLPKPDGMPDQIWAELVSLDPVIADERFDPLGSEMAWFESELHRLVTTWQGNAYRRAADLQDVADVRGKSDMARQDPERLCLESAGQFALAHMPPDEDFIPQLRLKEFKLYLAKALRRDAERVGSNVSGVVPTKSNVEHEEASAGETAHKPKSASADATGLGGESFAFRERATGSMDRVSMTDPIWDFSGTQNGPLSIKRLSGKVDVIDPSIEDEPDDADLRPEEELRINEATIGGRSELRSEIETAFSGPDWPPPHAIIQAFRRHAVKVFDANAAAYHRAISEQRRDAKETLSAMSRNLLVGLFGREWENSPGERVVRIKWQDGVDGWKGEEFVVIAGNDPDPTCIYHQLVGDAIKHRYRFHAPLPPHVPGEPPGLGVSNLEWWQYIGLKERHNLAMVIRPYLEDRIAHWQFAYAASVPTDTGARVETAPAPRGSPLASEVAGDRGV